MRDEMKGRVPKNPPRPANPPLPRRGVVCLRSRIHPHLGLHQCNPPARHRFSARPGIQVEKFYSLYARRPPLATTHSFDTAWEQPRSDHTQKVGKITA